MKIAMISDAWFPVFGGKEIHIEIISKRLIEKYGCEIDIFIRALNYEGKNYIENENLYDGKLRIIRCGRPKEFFNTGERILSIFSTVNRILKENKIKNYDIIHAHNDLGLLIGKIVSLILKKPIVATVHGSNLLDTGKGGIYYYVEKLLLTKIKYDLQITVGSGFFKHKNVNKNIKLIPNGVDIEKFDAINLEKDNSIFKILFVGRMHWTKGIDILIEAINKIDKHILDNKKVEIHLIGYGYQEDEYKELVKKYKLEKYFKFRGKIIGDELIKEYKTSHLFVLPSRAEGFPLVILEAMAARVPVIASICGGPEDIIRDGENGFLFERENVEKLVEKIRMILNGEVNLDKIVENAYKMVKEKYTRDKIVENTYSEYLYILNK